MRKPSKGTITAILAASLIMQQGMFVVAEEPETAAVQEVKETEAPAPQTEAPAPQTEAPTPQTEAPAPQTEAPAPQTEASAPQTEAPAQTEGEREEAQAVSEPVTVPEAEKAEEPAAETGAPETQAPETKAEETAAQTEKEIRKNAVAFILEDGVKVFVEGKDITKKAPLAIDGEIIFKVSLEGGFELDEIRVDHQVYTRHTVNKATGEINKDEYIIEGIKNDNTLVEVKTKKIETEAADEETETEETQTEESEAEIAAEVLTVNVDVACEYDAPYYYEDELTLTAQADGDITWEISYDGETWETVSADASINIVLDAENAKAAWRAVAENGEQTGVSEVLTFGATEYIPDSITITQTSENEAPYAYGDVIHFHADYFTLSSNPHVVWEGSHDGETWTTLDAEGADITLIVSEATDGLQVRAKLLTDDTIA